MNKISRPQWDDYFMALAFVVAMRSPDPSTKHGSVLCDKKHRLIGAGYNGFLRGCDDQTQPMTRPEKYTRICHSEPNCILNSSIPYDTNGCILYVTGYPCNDCLKIIIQSGIKEIVCGPISSACVTKEMMDESAKIIEETGIKLTKYTGSVMTLLENTLQYAKTKN